LNKGWKLQPDDLWFAGGQDSGVVYRYDGQTLHGLKFPKTKAGEEYIARYPRSQYPNMTYSPYDVYIIFKDSKGHIWFGTNIGVCRYDGDSFAWISEQELGFDDTGRAFNVRSIIEDKDGKFWFSSTFNRWDVYRNDSVGQGMNFRKEPGIGQPKDQNADPFAYCMSSVKTDNGDLWMATYGAGVWRYDGKSMIHYPVKKGDAIITLFSIYKDKQGDLWLGTHSAGAYKFNGKSFEKFRF
jgi:ligand-binding sensor domain-containing protein